MRGMTLTELASAAIDYTDHDDSELRAHAVFTELARRQKMLDAAEGLALAIKDHDNAPKDVLAWAADYESAKETP